ncbi:Nn.00g016770.m01.CDS01 [Neocucurbitaria sp. VM-36]
MSEYSYDIPRRHRTREPEYVSETTYIERGGRAAPVRDLVYRPREDSIEDIPRDFPPPGAEYRQTKYREEYAPPRRTRSMNRGYDDDYDRYDRGRGRRDRDYDDYSEVSSRPKPSRRKSIVDQVKEFGEAAGLGGVIGAVTGRSRSRSRPRRDDRGYDRGYDSDRNGYYDDRRDRRQDSRSSSRSRGGRKSEKWEQAAKAALVAGAVEAFRSRKVPGPWTGAKGQRIATAALGAAGIDGLIDRDPEKHEKRHVVESALGGLVATRLANGSRSRSRPRGRDGSRSRSQSRSRSIFGRSRSRGRSQSRDGEHEGGNGLAKVAGTGAVIAAGKALYDRVRSKSRSRRERSRSSSADSYVPSRRGNRRDRSYSRGRGMDDQYSEGPSRANPDRRLAAAGGAGALAAQGGGDRGKRDSSSDSDSTTDMEERRKKLRGKELLTAGLATVATIHAAHGVYSSMVASEKRRKLVSEGEMSPEEARKRKSKNMLQDAAAVGIAALGIKSAYSEWKEMNEQRHSVKELEARRRKRRKQRERREKEARQNVMGGMNGAMANPYAYPVAANPAYPTSYSDANPYGAMPPPPMGARY